MKNADGCYSSKSSEQLYYSLESAMSAYLR